MLGFNLSPPKTEEISMGQTNQEITINASVDAVWNAISDFHNIDWSEKVLTKIEKVGDTGGKEIGAKRILNDVFHETLLSLDEANHTFTYSITEGPPPISSNDVKNYIGKVVVSETDGGTKVVWTSIWENNDEAAQDFCHGIYIALLGDLKASLE